MFVNVAINIPSAGPFTYGVPDGMEGQITIGKRVLVPFGRRNVTGYIVEVIPSTDIPSVKNIIDLLDSEPLFNAQDLALYRWTSEYYLYPLGKTLKALLPGGIDVESSRWICLSDHQTVEEEPLSEAQRRILGILADYPQGLPATKLEKVAGRRSTLNDLKWLQALQLISVGDRVGKATVKKKQETRVALRSALPPDVRLTEKQKGICEFLEEHGVSDMSRLRPEFKNVRATITRMKSKNGGEGYGYSSGYLGKIAF